MKVKITGHTPIEGVNWWYHYNRYMGKVFEVEVSSNNHDRYVATKGKCTGRVILKQDCEVIND